MIKRTLKIKKLIIKKSTICIYIRGQQDNKGNPIP